jgi:FkbM family methyltransferase
MSYKHTEAYNDKWINEIVFPNIKGYFVEAGAVDGIGSSTCYALEKRGWNGICVEANKYEFGKLKKNRKAKCMNVALSNVSGKVKYYVSKNKFRSGILECLEEHKNPNEKSGWKKTGKRDMYFIQSFSLHDLLKECNAPSVVNYLSLDIEGAEYNVLSGFDFNGPYKVMAITIEGYNCIKFMKEKGYLHVHNPFNRRANYEQYFIHPDLKDSYPPQHLQSKTRIPEQFQ